MISQRDDEGDDQRRLPVSLVLSVLIHALLLPLLIFLSGFPFKQLVRQRPEHIVVIRSSALAISKKPKPVRGALSTAPVPRIPTPVRRSTQRKAHPRHHTSPPQRHEIARIVPHAPPQPRRPARALQPKASFSRQLAQQEREFARETQRLQKNNNPLGVAKKAPHPSTLRKDFFNFNGQKRGHGDGILYPIRSWHANGEDCYYLRYTFQYAGGGSEAGSIPWPACWSKKTDPLLLPPHLMPMPTPPPGYAPPPGRYLPPQVKRTYNAWRREHKKTKHAGTTGGGGR
ncbi:MAG: hypothetical protein ACYDA5_01075 [Vulcanimicrobiaceae bacterium]